MNDYDEQMEKVNQLITEEEKESMTKTNEPVEFGRECITVDSLKEYLEKLSEGGYGDAMIFMGESAPIYRDALCFNSTSNKLTILNIHYDRKLTQAIKRARRDLQHIITTYIADCYEAGRGED